MPCNVLQPPSSHPFHLRSSLSLSLFPFSLRHRSPIVLLPLACYHHALATPLALSRRGGVRSKFNFHQPTPLTYLPSASPSPCFSTTSSASSFFSTSPITPPGPPHHSGDPQHPGKEATGCIPRDKLRGSIIHGNLQAPLFKRRPFSHLAWPPSPLPPPPGYLARWDINTKTGDFKWLA